MTPDFQVGLQAGFRELQNCGYFAQASWQCCNTCGVAAVPEANAGKYVFYHEQEAIQLCERDEVNLNWAGDGKQIAAAFERHGLTVNWDGTPQRKICVSAPSDWQFVHPDDRKSEAAAPPLDDKLVEKSAAEAAAPPLDEPRVLRRRPARA